jgi:hypothetical protein
MGVGFGGDIYLRASLNDGSIRIFSRPIFGKGSRGKHLDDSFLPVSSNDSLDITPERDAFFGVDRHGDTALSSEVPNVIATMLRL